MTSEPRITVADIVEAVAAHCRVSAIAIRSQRRDAATAHARHLVCWLACRLTECSTSTIGARLGGRDHTTILHGRDKIEALRADPAFVEEMDGIEAAIRAVAELRQRRLLPAPIAIDPLDVARRVADGDERTAGLVSIAEIAAVCKALDNARRDVDLRRSAVDLVAAHREYQRARYSPGERHARNALERALEGLSKIISTTVESSNV